MRTILKRREPASLVEYRLSAGADYENYRDKDTLRNCLVKEQRGLCCYCMSRIHAEWNAMKIEHWHCQANYENEQLDYSNLLAACMGNHGCPETAQHCDTRKGNRDLSRNPANPIHHVEDLIRFLGDGTIVSNDRAFNAELNEVLNLNLAFLRNNRKGVLKAFQRAIEKRGTLSREALDRLLGKWNGESDPGGRLEPFCQVVVYWVQKKQKKFARL